MKRDRPKYVYDYKGVLYFKRKSEPAVKMRNQAFDAAFWAEYATLLNGVPQIPLAKSFTKLLQSYVKSARWKRLKPRTQEDYRKQMDRLDSIFGPFDPAKIKRKDVIRMRDSNADNYRKANYLVQVLRVLMEHAIDEGWRAEGTNPAKGVAMLKSPHPAREPWPPEMILAYREKATGRPRLVFELCLGTGQRIGDVLKMKWSDIEGDGIKVTQNKTGKPLWVPFTASLRETLAPLKRRSLFIVAKRNTGQAGYRMVADEVMAVRKEIGAEAYDIHGLRYSAAVELCLAGCSDELIAAVTGQSLEMVRHYTASVRQKVRAIKAQEKRR